MQNCPQGHGPLPQDGYRVTTSGNWLPKYGECIECHAQIRRDLKRLVKEARKRRKEQEDEVN
jgi:hypothetical protein